MNEKITSSNRYLRDGFIPVPCFIANRRDLNECQKLVMGSIVFHCWQKDHSWPSIDTVAKEIGVCRDSVIEAIKRLEKKGFLKITRRSGYSNLYELQEGVENSDTIPVENSDTYPSKTPTPTRRKLRHESEKENQKREKTTTGVVAFRSSWEKSVWGGPDEPIHRIRATRRRKKPLEQEVLNGLDKAFLTRFPQPVLDDLKSICPRLHPAVSVNSSRWGDFLKHLIASTYTPQQVQLGVRKFKERLDSGVLSASGKPTTLAMLDGFIRNALTFAKEGEVIERCMYSVYPPDCVGISDVTLRGGAVFQWVCGWCKTPVGWKQKECPMCKVELGWKNGVGGVEKWAAVRDQMRKEKGIKVSK